MATPGAVDTHVHLLSPRVLAGVAVVRGDDGDRAGDRLVWGVGLNSPWLLRKAFAAFDQWPVNIGFLARGSSSDPRPLVEGLAAGGACGFKVHEDLGAHPRCLDTALTVADTLAVAVLAGPSHAFHVEGCGGGYAPNVLELAAGGSSPPRPTRRCRSAGRRCRAPGHDRAGARPGPGAGCGASPGPDPGRHDGGRRTAARPGCHPGGGARGGLGRGGQAGRHRAVGPGLVRRQAHAGAEGWRVPAWGATGDPNAAIDIAAPLVLGRK